MTSDNFHIDNIGPFMFYHPTGGFSVTEDSPNLINFISHIDNKSNVVDIGTGSLVLPLWLLSKFDLESVTAVEHPDGPIEAARLNISKNNLNDKVRLLEMDYRQVAESLGKCSFDVVVSNPPYKKAGTGRISPDRRRALSTTELCGTFEEMLVVVNSLLKAGGVFYFVQSMERFGEITELLGENGFIIKRIGFAPSNFNSKVFFVKAHKS